MVGALPNRHVFNDDGVCIRCGFDGAEWWHLERINLESDCSNLGVDTIAQVCRMGTVETSNTHGASKHESS